MSRVFLALAVVMLLPSAVSAQAAAQLARGSVEIVQYSGYTTDVDNDETGQAIRYYIITEKPLKVTLEARSGAADETLITVSLSGTVGPSDQPVVCTKSAIGEVLVAAIYIPGTTITATVTGDPDEAIQWLITGVCPPPGVFVLR